MTGASVDDSGSQLLAEEEKKVEDNVPLDIDNSPETEANANANADANNTGMSWKLKLHLLGTFLFMMVFYVVPLGFTSWLFSSDVKQ